MRLTFSGKYCKESNFSSLPLMPWKGTSWANNWECPSHWVCDPTLDTLREGVCFLNLLPKGLTNLKQLPWSYACWMNQL